MTPIRQRSKLTLLSIIALAITSSLCSMAIAASEESLQTATASYEIAAIERVFDGTVEAVHQATMSAQTGGRIAELNYDVDDFVEVGSVLVRFTDVEQRSALRQANAQLAEARARQTESEEEYRRAQELKQRGLGSQRDLDRALAARDSAIARVASAESAIETAQQQLDYTTVKAPYAGIVTKRFVERGETVAPGQPLMSGLSLEKLRVAVDLPQTVATEVRKNPQASVVTAEGRVAATDITLFPIADPVTNTFRVRLELPDGQFGLYPGMFVKAAFAIGEAERLLIPAQAVLRRSEVTAVYVVGEEGVRLRQVRTGQQFGEHIEILSGLADGEKVALDPVRAGMAAKVATG
ncbi:MAG: efflux RND transporter periplasmic adaptor subunit [Xanthomonadales bacterium]|nr:efflux RND transporter periplasmic adaptor subunit [Gammaproteobacteria bacterium]MBT8073783.1 efflux RND transporter periplasmic adaptor subunit [Gammaproteobacteria bacterium]NNK04629.1 efflux RND transporter periplasmic adaptor subunit [Xanthomonadales bacterium]